MLIPLIASTITLGACWIEFGDSFTEDKEVLNSYYSGYNLDLEGDRLAEELQRNAFDKHTKWILYSQFNSYCARKTNSAGETVTDSIEATAQDSNLNEWFYTGKEASGNGTREHVWPCANSDNLWVHAKVDSTGYFGGGSDLYHVRTCDSGINTKRGNSKFVQFSDKEFASVRGDVKEFGENNGKYKLKLQGFNDSSTFSQRCEPHDKMKGDVARIIVYIWMHYTERGDVPEGYATSDVGGYKVKYSDMVGGLQLTSIMGYNTIERCKQELIEWNKKDKPSTVEKLRNHTVQKIQGNRNPFVDYPELVEQVLS